MTLPLSSSYSANKATAVQHRNPVFNAFTVLRETLGFILVYMCMQLHQHLLPCPVFYTVHSSNLFLAVSGCTARPDFHSVQIIIELSMPMFHPSKPCFILHYSFSPCCLEGLYIISPCYVTWCLCCCCLIQLTLCAA